PDRFDQVALARGRFLVLRHEAGARRLDRRRRRRRDAQRRRDLWRPGTVADGGPAQLVVEPGQLVVVARVLLLHAAVLVDRHELAAAQRRDLAPRALRRAVGPTLDRVQLDP